MSAVCLKPLFTLYKPPFNFFTLHSALGLLLFFATFRCHRRSYAHCFGCWYSCCGRGRGCISRSQPELCFHFFCSCTNVSWVDWLAPCLPPRVAGNPCQAGCVLCRHVQRCHGKQQHVTGLEVCSEPSPAESVQRLFRVCCEPTCPQPTITVRESDRNEMAIYFERTRTKTEDENENRAPVTTKPETPSTQQV